MSRDHILQVQLAVHICVLVDRHLLQCVTFGFGFLVSKGFWLHSHWYWYSTGKFYINIIIFWIFFWKIKFVCNKSIVGFVVFFWNMLSIYICKMCHDIDLGSALCHICNALTQLVLKWALTIQLQSCDQNEVDYTPKTNILSWNNYCYNDYIAHNMPKTDRFCNICYVHNALWMWQNKICYSSQTWQDLIVSHLQCITNMTK